MAPDAAVNAAPETAGTRRPAPPALLAALGQRLGDRFSTNAAIRQRHGQDESYHPAEPPDGVAFPESAAEVSEIVRLVAAHGSVIIPFGVGTSLEGGIAARQGGIALDMSAMNRITRVSPDDLDATVEAGVTRKQLNTHLRDQGLFFPIDPGADATLGGMAATRASGTNAVRYGTMRDNVLGLTVVLADGEIVTTGGRARKSAAGYDLTRLIIGSEGTLGVICDLTVRLHGIPEAMSAAVAPFPDIGAAIATVIEATQLGVPMARVEFLDEVQIDAVNRYSHLDYPVAPTLFFEFHGSTAGVAEQAEAVGTVAEAQGCRGFRWATRPEDRNRLWEARHNAYYAGLALRPGARGIATDVCVPISRLADCLIATKVDIGETGLLAPIVGHVGDGNFHLVMVIDPDDHEEVARAEALHARMVRRALAMGGTCTGEHGIGYGKRAFLREEHGPGVDVMQRIKTALDPTGVLNPGKVV